MWSAVQVRAFVIGSKATEEAAGGGADCHSQKHGHWIVDTPIANPSSYSEDLKSSRKSWGIDAIGTVVVEVELYGGHVGVGISIGGEPACYIIENHLARFVEGQDVHNIELMWEQMYKVSAGGNEGTAAARKFASSGRGGEAGRDRRQRRSPPVVMWMLAPFLRTG